MRFRIAPLLLTNFLTFVLLLGWQVSIKQQEDLAFEELKIQTDQVQRVFAERLDQTAMAMGRYASRIALLGTKNEKFLALDSSNYTSQLKSIRRIGITDPKFTVVWSFPKEQRAQVAGYNQGDDPIRRQTFEAARDTKQPVLSPFVRLRSGENGCLISAPMYDGLTFKGTAYATLSAERLFAGYIPDDQFEIAVREKGQLIYERKAKTAIAPDLVFRQTLQSGFANWEITTAPTRTYVQSHLRGISLSLLILGEALILLLGFLVEIISRASHIRREFHAREQVTFRRLDNALESGKMAAFSLDFATGNIWRSKNNDRIFGYPEHNDEWTMAHVLRCIPIEDQAAFVKEQKLAFTSRDLRTREFRIRRIDDQTIRWLRIYSQTTFNEQGQPIFSEGVLADVTLEKSTAIELHTAYSRLQRVIESSGEGIWERDFDTGELTYFDDNCRILFGFERGEAITLPEVTSLILEEDRAKIAKNLEEHTTHKTTGFAFDFRARDRRNPRLMKWIRTRGRIEVKSDGSRILAATLRDVSDEVINRRQLELAVSTAHDAVLAKSTFLANMSHEIRTPLNGLLGMTDLLLETQLDTSQKTYAQIAQQSGASLLMLINDVLDFSKIEAGKLELDASQFNVATVVESQVDILMAKAKDKGITISSFISPEVPALTLGDPGRLGQVLLNLIGNAIKFTAKGGVFVTVEKTGALGSSQDAVHVQVRDTGIGISQDAIETLFSPFVQANAGISKTYGGTGLGLSISKKIVEAMGGKIGIESTLGAGSTFWFTVPLKQVAHMPQARRIGWENLIDVRTLVIERDDMVCESLSKYLTSFKMRSRCVASLSEAADALSSAVEQKDLYQLVMIGRSGTATSLGVVDELRELMGDTLPVCIQIAEFGAHDHHATIKAAGFAGIVNKPVKQSSLLDAVVTALNLEKNAHVSHGSLAPVPMIETSRSTREFKILVADDVPVNLMLTQKMLEFLGYSSMTVANGREVLEVLKQTEFDLILMDCQMPEMNGFEATKAIRQSKDERIRKIPIVALTANAVSGDQELCINAGMNDYLSKPMKKEQLAEKLNRWLVPDNKRKSA